MDSEDSKPALPRATFTVTAEALDASEDGLAGFNSDLYAFERWLGDVLASADFSLRVELS